MKIGLVASIWISVPPKNFGFGAQEYLEYYIAEGLKKRGHDVTLFATGDSKVTTKLVSVSPTEVSSYTLQDPELKNLYELSNLSECYSMQQEFDIIHNHLLPYGMFFTHTSKTPTVHTLHHKIYTDKADAQMYERFKNQNYISISNSQRSIFPSLNYIKTVYNGIDTKFYNYKEKPNGKYLLYIGRMKAYKGIHIAIHIAKHLGLPLKIASPLPYKNQHDYDEVMEYWNTQIKPNLSSEIEHIGEISGKEKIELLQNAYALIFPVEREEPFGMTVVEAMSCGTPVIAYSNGSMPEIIVDKKTGFLIQQTEHGKKDMETAVKDLFDLPENEYMHMRKDAREHTVEHFDIEKMVDNYEEVYKEILNKS